MPQEPKKRHSRQRQGKRRAAISLRVANTVVCENCSNTRLAHMVCDTCGFYKGMQVVTIKAKTAKK